MPQLFSSKEAFESWFDFAQLEQDNETRLEVVKKLHKILKPFILRRTKADLATKLPDKIEINIAVQLSDV